MEALCGAGGGSTMMILIYKVNRYRSARSALGGDFSRFRNKSDRINYQMDF